jgi:hypothetical protein
MSEIREVIREQKRSARNSRIYGYITTCIIGILLTFSFYVTKESLDAKETLAKTNISLENSLEVIKEKNIELEITKENLNGEKEKLEEISIRYDSLRQAMLELQSQDELWDLTVEQNTVQAYTDYIKVKGVNDKVVQKLDEVMDRTGYVQIQESDGTMLFTKIEEVDSLNIYVPNSARSVRAGVIGRDQFVQRKGDVILKGQPVQIIEDSIYTGKARWAKIKY